MKMLLYGMVWWPWVKAVTGSGTDLLAFISNEPITKNFSWIYDVFLTLMVSCAMSFNVPLWNKEQTFTNSMSATLTVFKSMFACFFPFVGSIFPGLSWWWYPPPKGTLSLSWSISVSNNVLLIYSKLCTRMGHSALVYLLTLLECSVT